MPDPTKPPKTYIVEHLDPELEAWSALEYATIARESHARGSRFLLSGVSPQTPIPPALASTAGFAASPRGVEELYPAAAAAVDAASDRPPPRDAVCLLDPAAERELAPADAAVFDVFLFGGILGACYTPPRDFYL
jgi:ribosome biogenesis SPOUT family RNA methylase Rps3